MAAVAGASLLITAGAVSLAVLRARQLELQRADANRVNYHLMVHLDQGRKQLRQFLQLPPAQWRLQAGALLPSFSDLYELDARQQVRQVIKATAASRVFEGFSFAGSAISNDLRPGDRRSGGISAIVRGLEDEHTSIYVWQRVDGRQMLGRIQLGYIKDFLKRYSAFSGTPTLLVSRDGFVLLSGLESPRVASIDLGHPTAADRAGEHSEAMAPLVLGDRTWLPVASDQSVLGAEIVTLLPTDQLAATRQVLLSAGALVLVLWALIFLWKNRRLDRELFDPVARFSERILAQEQLLRQGCVLDAVAGDRPGIDMRFRELAALQTSFGRLLEAITQRDQALRHARELQRRNEERQRQQLQSKLRSSLMAASVAHEINLPLATIRMLCNQARHQLGHGASAMTTADLVIALSQQSQQVSSVIEKMRMLLRNVQTEHQPIHPVPFLLGACRSVKPLLREQEVNLELHGLEHPPTAMLEGDAVQLQMAVVNLLRNGIEAAAERPVGQRRLRLSLAVEACELVVEVSDSGPGFAFEPSDETLLQSSKPGGSGLGLFVVRTTLEHHHGRLSFGRCPRLGGACVRLHLPLALPCATIQPRPLEVLR
jgi:signal transduction histidine kinase